MVSVPKFGSIFLRILVTFQPFITFPCTSVRLLLLWLISLIGRATAQAVSRWLPTDAVRGSKPDLVMWDLWWDKVALGQVFSEYFGFPCNRRSLHQLLHTHPHVSSGECTIGKCGRSAGSYRDLGDLKTRDLMNLNLGDLKKGPKGA
jgi:hypothetical protein